MLRYGLDIGTNSIGWCVLEIDPNGDTKEITATGVRIFPNGRDPQSKASLAVDRRLARSARRQRDRYLLRRADLMTALICHGLMPQDVSARKALELLDPYEIRARALDNAVPLHHLGRALFHLHQRRGFKSNRKAEGSKDDDPGKIKAAGDRLAAILNDEGYRTLGEFLAARHVGKNSNDRERQSVRARLRGEGAKAEYDFYPQRWMVLAELEALWAAQAPHHPHVLTDAALTDIREIMMRQRPLRPVDPGKCALDPAKDKQDVGGRRAPWALPSAQRFRIYQELANLTYSNLGAPAQRLDRAQRDALARLLFKTDKLTFKRIRRTLGLPDETLFNLESDRRDHLLGDRTAHRIGGKKVLGEQWHALDIATQDSIVELLLAADSDSEVVKRLCHDHGLSEVAAQGVAGVTLPDGHCRLGRRAIGKLLPLLRDGVEDVAHPETGEVRTVVIHYDEAARRAGYHHSDRRATTRLARLPYYGEALADHVSGSGDPDDPPEARFGRIPNPTVHIGLNQLRRVINALIATYGAPDQIVVELARELKLGQEEKRRIEREQTENQKKNDARRARLAELGQPDSGENRLRLRLYEEMDAIDRRCVYTGEQICIQMLFGSEVNIDHILPFSRTLDDGFANKVLCLRRANRLKTKKTPFEAFGGQMDWPDILRRAEALPKNKNWRFAADAMERFERDRDFLDRQLTDTAYLARIAKAYLGHVCNPDQVWVVPGRMTAMLRGRWGLNALLPGHNEIPPLHPLKNRHDHRHHVIDAFVAAVTTRAMLNAIAQAASRAESRDLDRLLEDMPEPFPEFREALRRNLDATLVSHKPDHGAGGKLHEATAYGTVMHPEKEDGYPLVHRKPLDALGPKEVKRIRDKHLRARVQAHLEKAAMSNIDHKNALASFAIENGIRRVRLLKKDDVVAIADNRGRPYKSYAYGENLYIDVIETSDGRWVGEGMTRFDANRNKRAETWREEHPGARHIMRLYKNDMVRMDHEGVETVFRVSSLESSQKRVRLVPHEQAGNPDNRHKDPNDPYRRLLMPFAKMKAARARKVYLDEIGRIRDPGPPS